MTIEDVAYWLVVVTGVFIVYFRVKARLVPPATAATLHAHLSDRFSFYVAGWAYLSLLIACFWLCYFVQDPLKTKDPTDSQVVYETVSMLGVSAGLSIGALAFFVPLLLGLWANFWKSLDDDLTRLRSLQGVKGVDPVVLRSTLNDARRLLRELDETTRHWKPVFYGSFLVSVLLVTTIGVAFFLSFNPPLAYHMAASTGGLAIIELLWFFSLLSLFVVEIHPHSVKFATAYRRLSLRYDKPEACDAI